MKPNSSQLPRPSIDPDSGQTGYQSYYLLDGVNGVVGALVLPAGPAAITYGLSAYFLDTVEVAGTDRAITTAMANFMAADIEAQAAAGGVLTAAWVNARLVVRCGVATALGEGAGTATLEEILRILAGERYRLPANAVLEDGVPNFIGARRGAFVTAPSVELAASVRTTRTWSEGAVTTIDTEGPVRGRSSQAPMSHLRPGEPRTAPVQTDTDDVNFNAVRQIVDTGDLHLSATNGALAELKSAAFTFINRNAFAYSAAEAAANPTWMRAADLSTTAIPATGIYPAVVVYDVLGNVI